MVEKKFFQSENNQFLKKFSPSLRKQWSEISSLISKLETQQDQIKNNFAFSFIEGLIYF